MSDRRLCSYPGLVFCGHDLSCHLIHMFLEACHIFRVQANSSVPSLFSVGFSNFFPYLSILFKEKISFVVFVLCRGNFYIGKQFDIAWLPGLDWGNTSLLCPECTTCFAGCYLPFYPFFFQRSVSFLLLIIIVIYFSVLNVLLKGMLLSDRIFV